MGLRGGASNILQVRIYAWTNVRLLTFSIAGYVQNTSALDFSADQRRAHEAQFSASTGGNEPDTSSSTAGFGVDADSIWNTTKSWAATAGKKLSEAEAEVWKRVNGEK